jgi:cell division protein FtsN
MGDDQKAPQRREYSIQVGIFAAREGARELADQLAGIGYRTRIQVENQEGQTYYRVLVGDYDAEDAARSAQEALQREGFPGFLVSR